VRLAARGLRDMDAGSEPIIEPGVRERLVRQARMVYVKSFMFAVVLTALALLV
jgi:hypothetical protein